MRKFSTVLATAATGAVLATTGIGSAHAAGPESEAMETMRSTVAEGMTTMRSALATGPALAAESTAADGDRTSLGQTSSSVLDQLRNDPTGKPEMAAAGTPGLEGAGTVDGSSGGITDSCTGTKLGTKQMVNDYGTTVGRVELWYSPINNGRNCVITYNYIDGPSSYTDASIWVDDDGDGEEDRWRYDEGYYYSYAGASYLDNTNGKCIAISATVEGLDMNTDRDDAHHFRDWYHCG